MCYLQCIPATNSTFIDNISDIESILSCKVEINLLKFDNTLKSTVTRGKSLPTRHRLAFKQCNADWSHYIVQLTRLGDRNFSSKSLISALIVGQTLANWGLRRSGEILPSFTITKFVLRSTTRRKSSWVKNIWSIEFWPHRNAVPMRLGLSLRIGSTGPTTCYENAVLLPSIDWMVEKVNEIH